jgi:hypothetical protein
MGEEENILIFFFIPYFFFKKKSLFLGPNGKQRRAMDEEDNILFGGLLCEWSPTHRHVPAGRCRPALFFFLGVTEAVLGSV